jgi:hypothetical protein
MISAPSLELPSQLFYATVVLFGERVEIKARLPECRFHVMRKHQVIARCQSALKVADLDGADYLTIADDLQLLGRREF